MKKSGVQHRLTRVYLIQLLLISMATVLGVWATANIIEQVLVKQALIKEAEHYWSLVEANPAQPRPNTRHLLGLLSSDAVQDDIPAVLQAMPDGYHRVELGNERPIVYIERHNDARLYLIFDEQRVSVLAFLFGILPLTGVLLVIYITSFLGWKKSRELLSPLVQLSDRLRQVPVDNPGLARPDLSDIEADAESEVSVLLGALESYADRLVTFVERERQFTRDASHELRTPLAVFRSNLELLVSQIGDRPLIRRMEDTVDDMEATLETLLMLARTEQTSQDSEVIIVNDLAVNLMERLSPLAERKHIRLQVRQRALMKVEAPEAVLTILLNNLVRNAVNYSGSGEVSIVIENGAVQVVDAGVGMERSELDRMMKPFQRGDSKESGHGLGLAIVQRLCERYQWGVMVASEPGQGTQVEVRF
ncbi:HAMP domain-containing histidine kinase [Alcanivorax sp. S6407]|uniref:sensor histidine kinase n=1 Tax=Alcanivorax sp. S6407 TaxID=2926424 RepID=UPI001FF2E827|nr:HAMP domain-containing sensor histidine kinase [Alcanivorax sp. S6407]MCK0153017.1 HAMP domain-containing histidine kinase [Alcanivorax sp. S6407]